MGNTGIAVTKSVGTSTSDLVGTVANVVMCTVHAPSIAGLLTSSLTGGAPGSYYVSLCHMNSRGHVVVIFFQLRVAWDVLWNALGSQSELSPAPKNLIYSHTEAGLNYSGRQGVSDTGLRHLYILRP